MAMGICKNCKKSFNTYLCPKCGYELFSDEDFLHDEGGIMPQMPSRKFIDPHEDEYKTATDWIDRVLSAAKEIKGVNNGINNNASKAGAQAKPGFRKSKQGS